MDNISIVCISILIGLIIFLAIKGVKFMLSPLRLFFKVRRLAHGLVYVSDVDSNIMPIITEGNMVTRASFLDSMGFQSDMPIDVFDFTWWIQSRKDVRFEDSAKWDALSKLMVDKLDVSPVVYKVGSSDDRMVFAVGQYKNDIIGVWAEIVET